MAEPRIYNVFRRYKIFSWLLTVVWTIIVLYLVIARLPEAVDSLPFGGVSRMLVIIERLL